MKRISTLAVVIFTAFFSNSVFSLENFLNFVSPYPAGCATYIGYENLYGGGTQTISDGEILLTGLTGEASAVTGRITVTRRGCAEPHRSVLTIRLEILDDGDGMTEAAIVPLFVARIGPDDFPLRPTPEPNSWVSNESLTSIPEGSTGFYVIDVPSPLSAGFDAGFFLTPALYNGGFTLVIDNFGTDADYTADVSAYNNELQAAFIPFNGRLSGIWIVEGASDQGFLISFSELPDNGVEGLIFFSWYTFDADGNNVWLVGNGRFDFGDGTITFNLELVTGGEFMGSKTATRTPAGSVTIAARHCNLLVLTFDLSQIGLGQGTQDVVRVAGIETAGYTCLDAESKMSN